MHKKSRTRRGHWDIWRAERTSQNWYFKHPDFKRPVSTQTSERATAEAKVAKAKSDYIGQLHGHQPACDITVSQAIDLHIDRSQRRGKKLGDTHLKELAFLDGKFGDRIIDQVTQLDLEQLEIELRALGNCGDTIAKKTWRPLCTVRRSLKLMGHDLKDQEFEAPTDRPGKNKQRPWSDETWLQKFTFAAQTLYRETDDPKWLKLAALQHVLFRTGARMSSILRAEFDLENGRIYLAPSKSAGWRWKDLHPEALAWVKRVHPLEGPIFIYGANGKPGNRLYNRIKTVCAKAEIQYLSTHESGRRGRANKAVRDGEAPHVTKAALDWSSQSNMLEDVYTGTSDEEVKKFMLGS